LVRNIISHRNSEQFFEPDGADRYLWHLSSHDETMPRPLMPRIYRWGGHLDHGWDLVAAVLRQTPNDAPLVLF
jgi:hypothetical protein